MSTSPGIADDEEHAGRVRLDDELAAEAERVGVEGFLRRWQAQPMFATMPFDAVELSRHAAATNVRRIAHQFRSLGQGAQEPLWARLGELSMPVTVIRATLMRSTRRSVMMSPRPFPLAGAST